jgi:hypothetical protein
MTSPTAGADGADAILRQVDAPGAGIFRRGAPTLRLSTTSAAADAKTTYCSTSRSKPASAA